MQDYFAHCVVVKGIRTTTDYYYSGGKNKTVFLYNGNKKLYIMFEITDEVGIYNSDLEDNLDVFPWRVQLAREITQKVSKYWKKNKSINHLYASTRNNVYSYKLNDWVYDKDIGKYMLYYWVLESNRYYLYID